MIRFGLASFDLLSFQTFFQPPETWWRRAILARVSPRFTLTYIAAFFFAVDFFADDFLAADFVTVLVGVAVRLAPPLDFVSPALRPQVGQAPAPWLASTRRATAICSDLVALWALLAYFLPPNAFQVRAENCSPP